ncbi:MAG TPA: TonB family protein [Pseudomonadales bacterium]
MATISITPRDRLSFTLFLAASLHAAIILGVGFSPEDTAPPAPTIEVTLATHADQQAPEQADFIAQANQQGSGTEAEVRETTTTSESDFQEDRINPVNPEPVTPPQPQERVERELLAAETAQEEQVTREDEVPVDDPAPRFQAVNYEQLAEEIASLEARIAEEEQALAKQPRVKRLTSVSTKSAVEAAYLNAWRQKVERIGNANYPAGGVYGDLRMLVVLRFDGSLEEVRILESSGHKVLDDAALRIVRLAAPYQDFPVEMRKKYDRLEIIRTWKFSRSGASLDT